MNNFLIPVDKANHFIAGTLIYVLSAIIFSPFVAIIPVIVFGLGKEIYDYITKKGTPDVIDFLFTILGALPPLILNIIK
jgi:hypothetical protein